MKLTATFKTDDDVITDTVEEIVRPFREDVKEWAVEAGHEITTWKMEGVKL